MPPATRALGVAGLRFKSDAELMRLCAAGESDAFAEVLRRHQPYAERSLQIQGCPPDQIGHVIGEVFWRVWRSADSYRAEKANLRAWIARICLNENRRRVKYRGRQAPLNNAISLEQPFARTEIAPAEFLPCSSPTPEGRIDLDELERQHKLVIVLIDLLPEKQAKVVRL